MKKILKFINSICFLKVTINKRAAPNPSFGIRHSTYVAPLIVEVKD